MGEIYLNFSQIVLLITNVVIKTRQVNKKHVTQLSLPKKFVDHRSQFDLQKCDNFPASLSDQVRLGY